SSPEESSPTRRSWAWSPQRLERATSPRTSSRKSSRFHASVHIASVRPVEGVDEAGDLRVLDLQPALEDAPGTGPEFAGVRGLIVRDFPDDEPHRPLLVERRVPLPLEVELPRRDELNRREQPPVRIAGTTRADAIFAVARWIGHGYALVGVLECALVVDAR